MMVGHVMQQRASCLFDVRHSAPLSPQGVIRKHVENHRDGQGQFAAGGGAPSAYEAGMKRFREYQEFWEKNHQPIAKAQNGSSPALSLSPALMEVWCGVTIGARVGNL